jgi:hypothetical protein
MVLLLIACAWILILSLVVGLCAAARAGDEQRQAVPPEQPAWELPQAAVIARRSAEDTATIAQPSGSLARSAA